MSQSLTTFNKPYDDSSNLYKFFKTLERFNKNVGLPLEKQEELEDYFQYRWVEDRNQAISTSEDLDLLE